MHIKELREKSVEDRKKVLLESKKELMNLRFQGRSGQLDNTARMREVRKTIARIKMLNSESK